MSLNPEFRRNLALELTTHPLLAMPGVMLLAFLLAYALARDLGGLRAVGWTAFGLFGGITVFWGTQLASASVLDEFRDNTWDTQRLSALGPWTLTWGKLLGGTVSAMALVATLLALRDIALLYFFSFAQNGRNAEMTAVIYLVLLYWLVPALLSAVGLAPLAQLILPHFAGNMVFAVFVSAAQTALFGWLALARRQKFVSAVAPGAAR